MSRDVERAMTVARLSEVTWHLELDAAFGAEAAEDLWTPLLAFSSDQGQGLLSVHPHPIPSHVRSYLSFDPHNEHGLVACVRRARGAAQGVRESISSEMWEQINRLHLSLIHPGVAAEAEQDATGFFRRVREGLQFFQGLVDATIAHDEPWQFICLVKYIERAERWDRFELGAAPYASVRRYRDGYGNATHLITVPRPHEYVEVSTNSIVWTLLTNPYAPLPKTAAPLSPAEEYDYLRFSRLVQEVREIELMAAAFHPSSPVEAFEKTLALMNLVNAEFEYVAEVTTVATTVADVVQHRRGVCQDFAHVLIGLCRAAGIPARYVSGYLIVDRSSDLSAREQRASVASHAWAEAFSSTHGWRGFDPTNNLMAGEDHVKMAIGRDYADVPPTRGTSRGAATERLRVTVSVERLE